MDKSSITWTKGSDWWLSRMTMGGKERYPKQIRVGDLDSPRVYYPVDRDALLALADEMEQETGSVCGVCMGKSARRIRKALGASDG